MLSHYTVPEFGLESFNCPHCNAFAEQYWYKLHGFNGTSNVVDTYFQASQCHHCRKFIFWQDNKIVYPTSGIAQLPNPDMPEVIQKDYLEARDIVFKSPRSACMLLRLCVEKICNDKSAKGKSLNDKIGDLVNKGLDSKTIEEFDVIRIIGGQAVHPLTIKLDDDVDLAKALFNIINHIVQKLYTDEKEFKRIKKLIPKSKKTAIKKRDTNKS